MDKDSNKRTVDLKRISSALLGFPLVVLVLLIPYKYATDIAMSVIAIFAMHEYLNAVSKKANPIKWVSYIACLPIAVIHAIPTEYWPILGFLAVPTLLLVLFLEIIATDMETNFNDVAYTFIGIAYIPLCIMSMVLIRGVEKGSILIWYLIGAGWVTDVFAYFIGKRFGKHKFTKVSPKKSIEGSIAGTVGAVVVMTTFTYFMNKYFDASFSYYTVALVTLVLSLIGQIGDLAASTIKRYVDVKDFSNLIPGHGGMLDRFDSLIFIAPFAYVLFRLL